MPEVKGAAWPLSPAQAAKDSAVIPSAGTEWAKNWPVVLASSSGVALCTAHIYSMGVLIAPLEAEFGWSRAQISSGHTISAVLTMIFSGAMGLLIDRVGPRRIALWSAFLFCCSLGAFSFAGPSMWSWLALWTVMGFAINGITPTSWTTAVSGLFVRSRGLALSVTLCGTGIGSSLTPLITNYLNANYGWRIAYQGLAGFWAVIVLPLLFFFFTSVKDRRRTEISTQPSALPVVLTGLTVREGFRSPRFIKLAIAAPTISLVAVSFAVNLVPILASLGITRTNAVEIASIVGVASIIGRLSGGYIIDRINGNIVAAVSVLMPIISCVLLLWMPGVVGAAMVAAAVLGLSLGAELDAVAYLATRHLGLRNFGVLFGTIGGFLALSTGFGPFLVSYTFDVTRSYELVLWAYMPLCVLSSILFLSLGKYPDYSSQQPFSSQ
jgi:MFS family permease